MHPTTTIALPFPKQTSACGRDRAGSAPAAPGRLVRDAPANREAPPMPTRTHAAGKGASEEDHDDDG